MERLVPFWIEAQSKVGLRNACIRNNARDKTWYKYFDFQEQQDGTFVCWYYKELRLTDADDLEDDPGEDGDVNANEAG